LKKKKPKHAKKVGEMATPEEIEKLEKAYEEIRKRCNEADEVWEKAMDAFEEAEAKYKQAWKVYYPIYKAYKEAKQALEDANLEWDLAHDALSDIWKKYQEALNAEKEA